MTNTINDITEVISNAYKTKEPIAFIRESYDLDEQTSYAVQDAFIKRKCEEENLEVAGYKISMTSAETQAIANTHEPAYGTLLTSNIIKNKDTVSLDSLFSPLIEPEIMFILTDDLSPGADEAEILEKSKIAAGIEIPDARYIDWFPNFSLADLLCDNTATGLIVVSDPVDVPTLADFTKIEMELYHNEEKISEGISSAVLGNPISAVKWLSQKLANNDKPLKKGMVISSGTFISPLPAKEGTYKVTYSKVGTAEVTFTK